MIQTFLTHAWKPDKPVKVLGRPRDTERGYYYIEERETKKRYVVPEDQIIYVETNPKEINLDDLL